MRVLVPKKIHRRRDADPMIGWSFSIRYKQPLRHHPVGPVRAVLFILLWAACSPAQREVSSGRVGTEMRASRSRRCTSLHIHDEAYRSIPHRNCDDALPRLQSGYPSPRAEDITLRVQIDRPTVFVDPDCPWLP